MAAIVETVPFDFDSLYSGIEARFAALGYDTVKGSNTSQLITAMAYMTSMLNMNTAININETILPLTNKKENAVLGARALGYEITHKQSYRYRLTITLPSGTTVIPKYAMFTIDSKTYYYMGSQLTFDESVAGRTVEIDVKEGTLHKYSENSDLSVTTTYVYNAAGDVIPQYYIDIPFVDVEENGIEVFVTYYDEYGNLFSKEPWERSKVFLLDKDTVLNKEFIRMDDANYKNPRIYFTLAGIGLGLRVGSIVEMNILTSSGADGYIADTTAVELVSSPIPNATVTNIAIVLEGTDDEDIESIKTNAPMFHNSANRAVTKFDYEAICNRHQTVKSSIVWGGDDEYPRSPGHIWFSFLPSTLTRTYTTDEFKFEFMVDNNGDYAWDYSLTPNPTTGTDSEKALIIAQYNKQLEAANDYLTNWYIEDKEIRSFETTQDGQLINPGVWDILDNYKIPTLQFHNRNPIYVDFEYDIQILKYNIQTSAADIYQSVFDVVNNTFLGNDVVKYEKFEAEYFDSSVSKRIDAEITDISGFTIDTKTTLAISKRNISAENGYSKYSFYPEYRDVFLEFNVPFEKYFDDNDFLMINKLPNIDTKNFIHYSNETDGDLYTDWSAITKDINDGKTQRNSTFIIAPIRIKFNDSYTIKVNNESNITFTNIRITQDFPEQGLGNETFDNVIVYHNKTKLTFGAAINGFLVETGDSDGKTIILLGVHTLVGDKIDITVSNHAGKYQLFNSFRKKIIIQLFVDAANYSDDLSSVEDYDSPKAYLTTLEGYYAFTTDNYYLTTEGYALVDKTKVNAITGPVIREVSAQSYSQSPIKMKLFEKCRRLNFVYPSKNFSFNKNLVPRLKRVTFLQGV